MTNSLMRNLFHLHIKATDEHFYFGNLKALANSAGKGTLDISIHTLYKYEWKEQGMKYENEKVVIRRGNLIS